MKKREKEFGENMKASLEAFKYLYKEQFKEFGRLIKERD